MEKKLSDWLPEGWTVEVRPRKRGRYKSSNYTCYIDPITKLKFYSKPQVFCFLQSESNSSIRPIMKSGHNKVNKSTSKPCAVNDAQGLPPGWTVDIKVRRRRKGRKLKTDKYYIEPGTGRVFCSMKQVFHYLETGEVKDRNSKKKLINAKLKEAPSLPTEEHKKKLPEIRASKKTLKCQALKDWDQKVQSKGEKKRVAKIRALSKVIQYQEVKDWDSKSQSEGKGDGDPDCKANNKITNGENMESRAGTRGITGSVKRAGSFPEETSRNKRREEWGCPGNTNVSPPAQAEVPASPAVNEKSSTIAESSAAVNENMIAQRTSDGLNDENEAADTEHKPVEVDELTGKKPNQDHEVSVMNLSKGTLDYKGINSSVVHKREEQIRDVLKKLQGPVLLPAGYIPLPPVGHDTCTFGSETNENKVADPFHFPSNFVLTDPCFACGRTTPKETIPAGGDVVTNEGIALDRLLSTSANVWDDPCFHFAVKTLASEFKVAGDSGNQ